MAYQKINWANGEAGNTPLNANNLNKMDDALDDFESRIGDAEYQIGTLETTVAGHTTAISGKMDKNNPTGTGTLEIMKVKTSELVAKNGNLYLPNAARYTANDTETFPKIADKFDSVDASISSHSDSIWHLNISVAQLNNNKLDKSGEVKISGGLEIESSTGIIGEEPSTSYINGFMLQIPQAEFSEDISVLTDSNDAVVNVGSVINTMKSDIQELKDNAGFEITSASPLNGCSASSIVGIDACGNSTQSGTPTPTNPIAIVDASGDVVAHTVNINKGTSNKNISADGATYTSGNIYFSMLEPIEVIPNSTITFSTDAVASNSASLQVFIGKWNGSTWIERVKVGTTSTKVYTWNVPSNTNKIYAFLYADQSNISGTYLQIEYGTTATSYVEYASNKITLPTLRSVGNVKDELIVNADGSGQIIRRIEHIKINSVDSYIADSNGKRARTTLSKSAKTDNASVLLMTTHFKGVSYNDRHSDITLARAFVLSGGGAIWFDVGTNGTAFSDQTSANQFMQDNDVYVDYILATPTTTTLTASEVSAIRQLQTYSGTTIIDSALDVKSVTYHAGVKEYIDWRFEQLATLMLGEE